MKTTLNPKTESNVVFNNMNLSSNSSPIVSGFKKYLAARRIWAGIALASSNVTRNPIKLFQLLKKMKELKKQFMSDKPILKLAKVDNRYFWDMNTPGWPAISFDHNYRAEAEKLFGEKKSTYANVSMVFMAITKKCPMYCEHCFEWDELNKQETLSLQNMKDIISRFQKNGVSQFQFAGGEPLVRINDLIQLLETAQPTSDFWISTSGFNLTEENAFRLKKAGLTGVAISLDHFDPSLHNIFRGYKSAYECVESAAANAAKAGLVITLSICATRAFITEDNLMKYAELATKLGASFIQILEPRAAGHYEGKDVLLKPEHEKILEEFYLKMNYNKAFIKMPIVIYHGYYQRRSGCFGAGVRYLYVDTDGFIHACPFCRKKTSHALSTDLNAQLGALKNAGCFKFDSATT